MKMVLVKPVLLYMLCRNDFCEKRVEAPTLKGLILDEQKLWLL